MALEEHGKGTVREVEAVPEGHVLHAHEIEWAKALAERRALDGPVLNVDEIWMDEPAAAQVDVSWDHFSRAILDRSRPAY